MTMLDSVLCMRLWRVSPRPWPVSHATAVAGGLFLSSARDHSHSTSLSMCGRYSITLPAEAIRELFRTYGEIPNWPPYYNAAPTTALPIVRQGKEGRELVLMQWGLIPWFSKDGKPSFSTINARAEGVQTAASYREPFQKRRCLVPANGYFEWTGPREDRQPHYFTRADGQPNRPSLACGIGRSAGIRPSGRKPIRSSPRHRARSRRSSTIACRACWRSRMSRLGCAPHRMRRRR